MTPMTSTPPASAIRHTTAPLESGAVFDAALAGRRQRLVRGDGVVLPLAVQRWHDDADADDDWLLARCAGATLDLGCGPGRLVVALADRGVPALGVDVSVQAVQRCLERGAAVLHRDAFERLPGEGRWQHVVLADGNIGIGGDPERLLRRALGLLRPGGSVLVETDPDPAAWWTGPVRVHTREGAGLPVQWAVVGAEALRAVAAAVGLEVTAAHTGPRCFSELRLPVVE